jgi:nitrogen fixation-related uncharacterized protein
MNEAAIAQTIVTVSLLAVFLGLFIWGWRTGQFKNIEEAKYTIFRRPEDPEDIEKQKKEEANEGGGSK